MRLDVEIEEISVDDAMGMGIRSNPALIVNGELKSVGRSLTVDEIKNILTKT